MDAAALITTAVVAGLAIWLGLAVSARLTKRRVRDLPPQKRWMLAGMLFIGIVIAAFCAWAFSRHHAGLGVTVLIVIFVLPEFVLVPLRIRRSQRAARDARQRRSSRPS